jgi:predicted Zn-dependent peptidase
LGETLSPDALIAAFDAVTVEDVARLAAQLFDFGNVSLSAVGRVEGNDYAGMLR